MSFHITSFANIHITTIISIHITAIITIELGEGGGKLFDVLITLFKSRRGILSLLPNRSPHAITPLSPRGPELLEVLLEIRSRFVGGNNQSVNDTH